VLPDVESQGVSFPEWTRKNAPFLGPQSHIASLQGWGSLSCPPTAFVAPAAAAVLLITLLAASLFIVVAVFGRSGSLWLFTTDTARFTCASSRVHYPALRLGTCHDRRPVGEFCA